MKEVGNKLMLVLAMVSLPFAAKANMVWPSLYIVAQYYTWYVIAVGLAVEFFAIRYFTKADMKKSAIMDITMNAISAVLGLILIPVSGIVGEILLLPFSRGTFDLSHWIFAYVLAVACNACIEGLSLKWIFKYKFKKIFWWLLTANAVSVLICAFVPFKM